jgi:hypothetical protein
MTAPCIEAPGTPGDRAPSAAAAAVEPGVGAHGNPLREPGRWAGAGVPGAVPDPSPTAAPPTPERSSCGPWARSASLSCSAPPSATSHRPTCAAGSWASPPPPGASAPCSAHCWAPRCSTTPDAPPVGGIHRDRARTVRRTAGHRPGPAPPHRHPGVRPRPTALAAARAGTFNQLPQRTEAVPGQTG